MKNQKPLPQYIETFFQEHLAVHRGVSPNTVKAYRDAMKLFLLFVANARSKPITRISIEDMTADTVLEFLKDIESARGNGAMTRNHRLAALRVFSRTLLPKTCFISASTKGFLSFPKSAPPNR